MDYAIEVKNVTKTFGKFTAVNNISFNIPKGKIFGFLGPNGSGKSTTIRMICGVLLPSSGEITVLGNNVVANPEDVKQNIGYMSQKFSLYEDLTVEENLDFYGEVYGLSKKIISERKKELIDMANLTGKEKVLSCNLSGGWKQRLALGCALIHKPKLLILDEPTAGVDPVSRRTFWEIIHVLSKQGITILVTTHYMDEAQSCDILGFIFNSNMLDLDSTENILVRHNASNLEDVFIKMVEESTSQKVNKSYLDMKFLSND